MTTLTNPTIDSATPRTENRLGIGLVIEASLLINSASFFLAFLFRSRFIIPAEVMGWFWTTLPAVLALKTVVLLLASRQAETFAKYNFTVNHLLFVAVSISGLAIFVLNGSLFNTYLYPLPRSVILMDWALSLLFWIRLRSLGMRFVYETADGQKAETLKPRQKEIPTISMGSGGSKITC